MDRATSFRARIALVALALVATAPIAFAQTSDPVLNLNFAAVNQNLWGSGAAAIYDKTISIPDPALHASVTLPSIDVENPASAVLGFITGSLGLANPLDGIISVGIAPSATVDASITAGYHINAGSLNVVYPTSVKLDLPDQILPGQSFTVGAHLPGDAGPPGFSTIALAGQSVVTTGGAGYAGLLNENNQYTAIPGFSTTFPYATADVNLNLKVSGAINLEACVIACVSDGLPIASLDLSTSIVHASTLDGVSVLGEQVLGYGTFDLGAGASITVHPPILPVNGDLQADQSLAGSSSAPIVDVSIGAEQFIPLIGQALHSEVGPFGYTLLSVEPQLTAGIYQNLSFNPQGIDVTLHFSQPMLRPDGTVGNDVTFQVGQDITLTPATVGSLLHQQVEVTPTFSLRNSFQNDTGIFVEGILNIDALKIDTPDVGPVVHESVELGTLNFPPLFSDGFQVDIAPITTGTLSIARQPALVDLVLASIVGGVDTDGDAFANLVLNDPRLTATVATNVAGHVFFSGSILNPNDFNDEQSFFLADQDVVAGGTNFGRAFCITCIESASALAASPSLPFLDADTLNAVYFSNLSTFPAIPTEAEVRATDPAFTPAPEPGTLLLMGLGAAVMARRLRAPSRRDAV